MRFLRVLLLAAATTLAGCGGGTEKVDISQAPHGTVGNVLGSTAIAFNATQGGSAPESRSVTFWWTGGSAYVTTSQTGAMFYVTQSGDGTTASFTVYAAAPAEAGSYDGTVTVNICSTASRETCIHHSGSPKIINIAYTVRGLTVTPAQLTFSSTDNTSQARTATLAVTDGEPSYTWQTLYSPSVTDWLRVTPSGGTPDLSNGPQTLTFNADPAGLPAGVHSAVVTFISPSGFSTQLTATLLVGDPSVNFVAPYVVAAHSGGEVIIRGRGFSALSPGTVSVRFNSAPATAAAVVSDTEIRATYPPLAAGSYSISVSAGATSIPSRTALKLVVIDPPVSALTTIQRPSTAGWPANLIYDAERNALLFTDARNDRILRYGLSGSGSTSTTLDTGWPVGRIVLSPDGTELIRVASQKPLVRLNPVTLAVLSSVDLPGNFGNPYAFAFANDGGALAGNGSLLYRYDMLTRSLTPVSTQRYLSQSSIFASADGGTLVLPSSIFQAPVSVYNATTGALTPRAATIYGLRGLSVSRNGSRMIVGHANPTTSAPVRTVYDAAFTALGTLPADAYPFVISPDGNLAYTYSYTEGRVRKFDLSAGGGATEIGSGIVVALANTEMSEMTISPDGGTLFLVGPTSVVITPAP